MGLEKQSTEVSSSLLMKAGECLPSAYECIYWGAVAASMLGAYQLGASWGLPGNMRVSMAAVTGCGFFAAEQTRQIYNEADNYRMEFLGH